MGKGGYRDRLIEVLLAELLGGERPPDVTRAVLARAGRGRRWALAGAAIAAGLLATVGVWWLLGAYPGPRAAGPLTVVGGGPVQRGATLVARERPATVSLGGYCRVRLHPGSRVRVAGEREAEEVFLEQGGVTCEVEPGAGRFAVATPVGKVTVTGTEFTVQLLGGKGDETMRGMQMLVRVAMGAVLVSGSWGQVTLGEGEERRVPERAASEYAAPASLRGFKGYLIGTLASVGRKGCTIEVANARAVDGSRARTPQAAVGQRVPVHYIAFVNREGGYRPSAELRARIARLRERGLVTLRVRPDGDILICDRAWAGAQLQPGRDDPERADREGERHREGDREGDREGEERRWRDREGDREGERHREGDREGDREGEERRWRDREGDREGERHREGDREGEGRRRGERDADF
ncbi:MAG: FecR domain-containing protein [bacterium]